MSDFLTIYGIWNGTGWWADSIGMPLYSEYQNLLAAYIHNQKLSSNVHGWVRIIGKDGLPQPVEEPEAGAAHD